MPSVIQLKTGTGSAVPSALAQGEVAINIDNGLFYYGSGSGEDVKQLESFTHITASGNISASGANSTFGEVVNLVGEDPRLRLKAVGANHPGIEWHEDSTRKWVLYNDPDENDKLVFKNDSTELVKINQAGSTEFPSHITASGDISASSEVATKHLRIQPRGGIADGGIFFGTGDENDDNGIIYDDGDNLQFGYNDTDVITIHDTAPHVNIMGKIKFNGDSGAGHITASGNISASGTITANSFVGGLTGDATGLTGTPTITVDDINVSGKITHEGDTDTKITLGNDDINITVGNVNMLDFTENAGSQDEITFNEEGADLDIRMEGDGDQNLFFLNAGTDRVGIGTNTPSSKLHVSRDITATHITASGNVSASGIIATTIEGTGTTTGIETSGYLSSSALYVGNGSTFVSASTGNLQGSGNITGFTSMSISYITASQVDVDGDTIRMGGEVFNKILLQNVKDGFDSSTRESGGAAFKSGLRTRGAIVVDSHITASGNISSSGNIIGNTANFQNYNIKGESFAEYNATADALGIAQATNMKTIDIGKPGNNANILLDGSVTASGDISSSGTVSGKIGKLQYDTGSISATGNVQGDIIKFGNTTTVAGAIYAHTGSGWVLAHSGSSGNASSSLGLAVGTNSSGDGMLLRGMANIGYDPGGVNGCALYLESPGSASHVSSGTSGHVVRVVGWNFGSDTIYFNPDNTWILRS